MSCIPLPLLRIQRCDQAELSLERQKTAVKTQMDKAGGTNSYELTSDYVCREDIFVDGDMRIVDGIGRISREDSAQGRNE